MSFINFPRLRSDEISVCGKNERISTLPVNDLVAGSLHQLSNYPSININRELFQAARTREEMSVLLPVNQNLLKQISCKFFEEGLVAALKEVEKVQDHYPSAASVAAVILRALEFGQHFTSFLQPTLKLNADISLSATRNWQKSPVRALAWHPNYSKLAVAAVDDSVRVYSRSQAPTQVPVLKRVEQKGILCMAWRPWSPSEIVVGTRKGLIIWNIDQTHISGGLKSQSSVLSNDGPVTSVSWNPNGALLASAGVSSPNILIWDVDATHCTPLLRIGPQAALVSWSPNGAMLCSTTTSNVFRIWNCDRWTTDRWNIGRGTIQSVCWTPCSQFMLFVTTEEPLLYSLAFIDDTFFASGMTKPPKQAIPVADLSKVVSGEHELEVGGLPQSVVISPRGNLLAVSFKESDTIAVFTVSTSKFLLNVTPFGLVNGLGNEYPSLIHFETSGERDVLTISWSSGRVQYFPFM